MQATVLKSGHVVLAKAVRDAANIRVGDRVEVECAAQGQVLLRRVGNAAPRRRKVPLLNVEGFPPGTLEAEYQQPDPEWDSATALAANSQRVTKFAE